MERVESSRADPRLVRIHGGDAILDGDLLVPARACGLILFAHGSGSSRNSARNRYVAHGLAESGFATLLFDLLTEDEEAIDLITRQHRFDIPLLARRLIAATEWVHSERTICNLPVGYFGASTGAAAALIAAAQRPGICRAVVSRGGRVDLAGDCLGDVGAPTLLIVGGRDEHVLELNQNALAALRCEVSLEIVTGATHLFEEPGKLDEVAGLARGWFLRHLAPKERDRRAEDRAI